MRDVAEAAQRAGATVTVVQSFHQTAEVHRSGVSYHFVAEPALPGRAVGFMPWRLAQAVRACSPDVIHIHGLDFPLHTRLVCGLGIPVLVQDHASWAHLRPRRRRWGLAKVAGVAFTDTRQAEPFTARGCFPPGTRLFAIAESSGHFSPGDRLAARAETDMHGDPAVLWVGRLDANKDPLTILDAVAAATPYLPGVQLWCCFHEQPLLAQVEARLARDPDLAGRVHLIGQVPHARVETLFRAADFFMLASHRESAGLALIEAMACGAIPIVSDIPSFRSLTADGRIGALAPVGDAAAFAAALIDLAGRPRAALHHSAQDHFKRALSFEVVGRALCDAYALLHGMKA